VTAGSHGKRALKHTAKGRKKVHSLKTASTKKKTRKKRPKRRREEEEYEGKDAAQACVKSPKRTKQETRRGERVKWRTSHEETSSLKTKGPIDNRRKKKTPQRVTSHAGQLTLTPKSRHEARKEKARDSPGRRS